MGAGLQLLSADRAVYEAIDFEFEWLYQVQYHVQRSVLQVDQLHIAGAELLDISLLGPQFSFELLRAVQDLQAHR